MIKLVLYALAIYLLVCVVDGGMAWRKGGILRFKYSLKKSFNNARVFVSLLVALYVCLFFINLIPVVNKWVTTLPETSSDLGNALMQSFPLGVAIFTIWLMSFIIHKGVYPKLKYNDQEKQWQNDSKSSRLGKYFDKDNENLPQWWRYLLKH
jgi:hypothetical protein